MVDVDDARDVDVYVKGEEWRQPCRRQWGCMTSLSRGFRATVEEEGVMKVVFEYMFRLVVIGVENAAETIPMELVIKRVFRIRWTCMIWIIIIMVVANRWEIKNP